jgi:hypothetical protein
VTVAKLNGRRRHGLLASLSRPRRACKKIQWLKNSRASRLFCPVCILNRSQFVQNWELNGGFDEHRSIWRLRRGRRHNRIVRSALYVELAQRNNGEISASVVVVTAKATIASRLMVRRGLSEAEAAVYLSLSPTLFRKMVAEGLMPKPHLAGRRRVWDIAELDLSFKALPREGGEAETSSWDDYT